MKTGKTEMDIRESAENLLMACMDVKEGEQVLVVADLDKYDLGYQVYETALGMNCEALFMCMKNRSVSGEEPPAAIAAAVCASDVVICITCLLYTSTGKQEKYRTLTWQMTRCS